MFGMSAGLGIDLGTSNILVYVRGRGIVLREPSVVAVANGEILAVGEEARQMLGRTPGNISAVQPLREGVIADFTVTQKMLRYLLDKVCGRRRLFKPQVVVCIPSGATGVEKRAVLEAAVMAGAKRALPIEEPMAAAIGASLDIIGPGGNLVVDIGGGTTDIAVIALGGIVLSDSVRIGGHAMDEAIARHIKRSYNLMVGERTAEEIKLHIGSAAPLEPELRMTIRGRDQVAGLPKTVEIGSEEVREALAEPVAAIVARVKQVLEQTPPELAGDVIERGITLTGGGALLRGIDRLLAEETEVPLRVAEDPLSCVAVGTGQYLEVMKQLPAGFLRASLEAALSSPRFARPR